MSNRNAMVRGVALAGLLAITLSGCSTFSRGPKVPLDSVSGIYDRARIRYALDAGKLNVPVALARIEGQLVSYQQVPTAPTHDRSLGTLELEYPHPERRKGYVLARVTIVTTLREQPVGPTAAAGTKKPSWDMTGWFKQVERLVESPVEVREVWELDLPKGALDQAIAELGSSGYFDRTATGNGKVDVETRIDAGKTHKSWREVPTLDALMVEVRSRGRLISYVRPSGKEVPGSPEPSSIAAYRAYGRQDGAHGTSGSGYLAAGPTYQGVSTGPAPGAGPAAAQVPIARYPTSPPANQPPVRY